MPGGLSEQTTNMTTLVLGATGATGKLLVQELLGRGQTVKAIVRSPESLSEAIENHENCLVVHAAVLDLSDAELAEHTRGCEAIASCLGHNLSLKGIFGQPRRLVTEATRRICAAVKANKPAVPVKFVLMNTTGNRNRDLEEPISFAQNCVIGLLRLLLPPHVDNEQAADFLRCEICQDDAAIEWVAVRPDGLIDEGQVTEYDLHPSPTRSAIFDAGKTSRINVGHFMAELISDHGTWEAWKGQMPVIYNR